MSKKVGNAVIRNTVRRRLKEIFYDRMAGIHADLDLVISARPSAANATYFELDKEFSKALHRLEVLGDETGKPGRDGLG